MIKLSHYYSDLDKRTYFEVDTSGETHINFANWFWFYLGQKLGIYLKPHIIPYRTTWVTKKNGKPRPIKEIRINNAEKAAEIAAKYIVKIYWKHTAKPTKP